LKVEWRSVSTAEGAQKFLKGLKILSATLANGAALPGWLVFDAADRTFHGTPANPDAGTISVKLNATDKQGATVATYFDVSVTAVAPAAQSRAVLAVEAKHAPSNTAAVMLSPAEPGAARSNASPLNFAALAGSSSSAYAPVIVERTSAPANTPADTSTLVVNRAVPEVSFASGQSLTFTLPRDTFVSSAAGQMTLKAVLVDADGRTEQALPSWIRFDPVSGTFSGEPPSGAPAVLRIKVIARDSQGNEAEVTLTIQNASTSLQQGGTPAKPQSKLTDEASDFAYDGDLPFNDGALTKQATDKLQRLLKADAKLAGRVSLSEQIRQASRHRSSPDRTAMTRRV
jgi:hypothetical protein